MTKLENDIAIHIGDKILFEGEQYVVTEIEWNEEQYYIGLNNGYYIPLRCVSVDIGEGEK